MGLEDFTVLSDLGQGNFARVQKVQRLADQKLYALKRVDISEKGTNDINDLLCEIRILASFNHPRIVRWFETFVEAQAGFPELCIVMELCPYGDLQRKITRAQQRRQYIDEREIWVYSIQLLEGLDALHSKGVVHRDLKPANCLIDEKGCVKIADMNISKVSNGEMMKTRVGTPFYMCPEIYLGTPYTATGDIWSLGCLIYALAALKPPFMGKNLHNLRSSVIKGEYEPLPADVYSADLTGLITKFVQVDPKQRPQAREALQDATVQRHMRLMRHPLQPSVDLSDDGLLSTLRAEKGDDGALSSIMLPGSAYDDAMENGRCTPKLRKTATVKVPRTPKALLDMDADVEGFAPSLPAIEIHNRTTDRQMSGSGSGSGKNNADTMQALTPLARGGAAGRAEVKRVTPVLVTSSDAASTLRGKQDGQTPAPSSSTGALGRSQGTGGSLGASLGSSGGDSCGSVIPGTPVVAGGARYPGGRRLSPGLNGSGSVMDRPEREAKPAVVPLSPVHSVAGDSRPSTSGRLSSAEDEGEGPGTPKMSLVLGGGGPPARGFRGLSVATSAGDAARPIPISSQAQKAALQALGASNENPSGNDTSSLSPRKNTLELRLDTERRSSTSVSTLGAGGELPPPNAMQVIAGLHGGVLVAAEGGEPSEAANRLRARPLYVGAGAPPMTPLRARRSVPMMSPARMRENPFGRSRQSSVSQESSNPNPSEPSGGPPAVESSAQPS